jgi:hypothetical protein
MPKKKTGGKPKSKPKAKPKPKPKPARYALAVLALLSVFLALPVNADETHIYPYGALAVDRISGPDQWSTGVTLGGEIVKRPLFIQVHFDIHDVLAADEDNAYPWDNTVGAGIGLYKSVELLGIAVSPNASFTIDRPSGIDRFSVGFDGGLEAAFDNLFLAVNLKWHDILTDEVTQVYPWDQTVRIALGGYLGDSPAEDEEEAEEAGS